jgi:hypothetical protein
VLGAHIAQWYCARKVAFRLGNASWLNRGNEAWADLGRTPIDGHGRILLGNATVAGVTGAAATAARADQDELRLCAEAKVVLTQAIATAERHLGGRAIGAKLDRLAPASGDAGLLQAWGANSKRPSGRSCQLLEPA